MIGINESLNSKYYANFVHPSEASHLCLVSRSADITTTTSPVDVDVLILGVLFARKLGLDLEGVCTEVITLGLKEVGRKIFGAVAVEP